jgi:predicted RNase H-like HicB family nuclease
MDDTPTSEGSPMSFYSFRVIVEPDEDRWFAYCPLLEDRGAATWGYTREEALKNIQAVLQLVLKNMARHGEQIPQEPKDNVKVTREPWVTVAV